MKLNSLLPASLKALISLDLCERYPDIQQHLLSHEGVCVSSFLLLNLPVII